jgi:hypothetical protein
MMAQPIARSTPEICGGLRFRIAPGCRRSRPRLPNEDFEVDESQFWELVQRAHDTASDEMDRKCEVLKAEIGKLSKNEASDFAVLFHTMMDRAYSHKLWGAAYAIHGGCSDDTFNDFRSSLISRGRACFERAIADPDSLADEEFDATAWFYEGYQYAVTAGVKAVAGLRPGRHHPDRPSGEDWVEDDLRELFPRLSTKFM